MLVLQGWQGLFVFWLVFGLVFGLVFVFLGACGLVGCKGCLCLCLGWGLLVHAPGRIAAGSRWGKGARAGAPGKWLEYPKKLKRKYLTRKHLSVIV